MDKKLAIIGIDSLDPYVLMKYREQLPVFDMLMKGSSTLKSKSIFPIDTIPAWASIYTGLKPENHGIFYVYDVFDPHLSDLSKVKISMIKGKTFWDYAGQAGYRSGIVYPAFIYPPWEVDGFMVNKSPFDKRIDWLSTEIDVNAYPDKLKTEYSIPDKFAGLWGGFPGEDRLSQWAQLGKAALDLEKGIGLSLYKGEKWDLFFIYFSMLDIIQHRLWRFFDENDPLFSNKSMLKPVVLDYYKYFDHLIGEFIEISPDMPMIVMSDHGHKSRPIKTFNVNEYLRMNNYLMTKGQSKHAVSMIRNILLNVASKLNIEHLLIKLVVKNENITKVSKSIYSSSGSIDKERSVAYASHFAGIKSYPHGGIEINGSSLSKDEYNLLANEIIKSLVNLKATDGITLMKWVMRREEFQGTYVNSIYPDIIFDMRDDYAVGWDVHSKLYSRSFDHKVASGGHSEDAVFLMHNIDGNVTNNDISIIDTTPTVLDILGINWVERKLDGKSIFDNTL